MLLDRGDEPCACHPCPWLSRRACRSGSFRVALLRLRAGDPRAVSLWPFARELAGPLDRSAPPVPEGRFSPNANQRGAVGKLRSCAADRAEAAPVPAPGSAGLDSGSLTVGPARPALGDVDSTQADPLAYGEHSSTEPLASLAAQRIDINGFDGNLQSMVSIPAAATLC